MPNGEFQAYKSYWDNAYLGHLAWAAAWMCKYDKSSCGEAAKRWDEASSKDSIKYNMGYDWDNVLPGELCVACSKKGAVVRLD